MPLLADSVLPGVPRHKDKLSKSDIHKLLGYKRDPLILEIGCNDGQDTYEFLGQFPDIEMHCFEPDSRAIAKFRKRIYHGNCKLHQIALSDKAGTQILHMSGGTTKGADRQDWDMSSSLLPPKEHLNIHKWCTFDRKAAVNTRTLDDWAEEFIPGRMIDFIWVDVQGAERLVFAGGQKTILENTQYIYSEFSVVEEYEGCWLVDEAVKAYSSAFNPVGIYEGYNILLEKRD
jgi:FkbM family methyltransferase